MILKKQETVVVIDKICRNCNENFENLFQFFSEKLKQVLECDIVYRNKCPIWGG